jgi:hypothetical protein
MGLAWEREARAHGLYNAHIMEEHKIGLGSALVWDSLVTGMRRQGGTQEQSILLEFPKKRQKMGRANKQSKGL